MKNNLPWYRHDAGIHNEWQYKMLRVMFEQQFQKDGWAGEGRYWALMGIIAKSDTCHLNCNKTLIRLSTASDLSFSPHEFDRFLSLLHECGLILYENGFVSNADISEDLASVQESREKAAERTRKWREKIAVTHTERVKAQELSSHKDGDTSQLKKDVSPTNREQNSTVHNSTNNPDDDKKMVGVVSEADASGGCGEKKMVDGKDENAASRTIQDTGPRRAAENLAAGATETWQDGQNAPQSKSSGGRASKKGLKSPENAPDEKQAGKTPFWKELRQKFDELYFFFKNKPYRWQKLDYAKFKSIVDSLQSIAEKSGKTWTLDVALIEVNYFFSLATTVPSVKKRYSLSVLDQEFNQILSFQPESGKPQLNLTSPLYTQSLENYRAFFRKRSGGIEPNIREGIDDVALAKLIAYFSAVEAKQQYGTNEEKVGAAFSIIYQKWDLLEPFIRDKMDLADIHNNINKIFQQIKSGGKTNGLSNGTHDFHARREAEYNRTFAETYASVAEKLGDWNKPKQT